MACNNDHTCGNSCNGVQQGSNCGYLIILVLYILLAILLGSCIYY